MSNVLLIPPALEHFSRSLRHYTTSTSHHQDWDNDLIRSALSHTFKSGHLRHVRARRNVLLGSNARYASDATRNNNTHAGGEREITQSQAYIEPQITDEL